MDTDVPRTREDLSSLDLVRTPMWIVDLAVNPRWWANRAGLQLWNAASIAEWNGRNSRQPPSAATRTRIESFIRRLGQGEVLSERWT